MFRSVSQRMFAALLLCSLLAAPSLFAQAAGSGSTSAPAGEQTTPQSNGADAAKRAKETPVNDEDKQYRESPTVTKFGAVLGMGPTTSSAVFTLINLLVLLGGVGYMAAKMVPKAFRDRSSGIQKQLVDARTATEEANSRLNSVEDRLSKLDEQIAGMRTQSEHDSVRDEQRIKASLEDEKAKIVAAAEAEIASATVLARRQIQTYAAELAIDHAARKLSISAETDRLLIENFANRLGGTDKGGQN